MVTARTCVTPPTTAACGLGGVAAQVRSATVAQPPFVASEEPIRVEGWVVANDASDYGPRLRLLVRSIEGMDDVPRYVRMSVAGAGVLTQTGTDYVLDLGTITLGGQTFTVNQGNGCTAMLGATAEITWDLELRDQRHASPASAG